MPGKTVVLFSYKEYSNFYRLQGGAAYSGAGEAKGGTTQPQSTVFLPLGGI